MNKTPDHSTKPRGSEPPCQRTLAEATGQSSEALLASLTALGLTQPEKAREKPATIDFGGEPVWLSKTAKDEIWFNAKPAREAVPEKKPRKARRPAAEEAAASDPASSDAPAS